MTLPDQHREATRQNMGRFWENNLNVVTECPNARRNNINSNININAYGNKYENNDFFILIIRNAVKSFIDRNLKSTLLNSRYNVV